MSSNQTHEQQDDPAEVASGPPNGALTLNSSTASETHYRIAEKGRLSTQIVATPLKRA